MAYPFLICGLPRSRTAWLSAFLSSDGTECGHEMMSRNPTPEKLADALQNSSMIFSGNSDTSQCLHIHRLRELMPKVRIAVILRPPDQVIKALRNIGIPINREQLQPYADAVEQIAQMGDVMALHVEALESESVCAALVNHLTPGVWFDSKRWELFNGLNIAVTPHRMVELQHLADRNFTSACVPLQAAKPQT